MSVDADQFNRTDVDDVAVALNPPGTVGNVRSTVHVHVAGVVSLTPLLVAYTEKRCEPAASPVYDFGLVHAPGAPASSLHVNVAPLWLAVNEKDAVV